MPVFCKNCGKEIINKKKFCENCGTKIEFEPEIENEIENIPAPAEPESVPVLQLRYEPEEESPPPEIPEPTPEPQQYTAPTASPAYGNGVNIPYTQPVAADDAPPKKSKYAPVGTLTYIGLMILMNIPVIGLISAILLALSKGNVSRRNFARATLVFQIIGYVIALASLIFVWITWAYINEFLVRHGIEVSFWF